MPSFIDLTGQKFDRLYVIRLFSRGRHIKWKCRCSCPNKTITYVTTTHLRSGHTKSCGCWSKERATKHGMWKSVEYHTYQSMMARCYNKKNKRYERYGGRGIKVCKRWRKGDNIKTGFEYFFEDMGYRPKGRKTLDRLNNDKNYHPNNCAWRSYRAQNNNKSNNLYITLHGKTKTLDQWCKKYDVSYVKAYSYIYHNDLSTKKGFISYMNKIGVNT